LGQSGNRKMGKTTKLTGEGFKLSQKEKKNTKRDEVGPKDF